MIRTFLALMLLSVSMVSSASVVSVRFNNLSFPVPQGWTELSLIHQGFVISQDLQTNRATPMVLAVVSLSPDDFLLEIESGETTSMIELLEDYLSGNSDNWSHSEVASSIISSFEPVKKIEHRSFSVYLEVNPQSTDLRKAYLLRGGLDPVEISTSMSPEELERYLSDL